MVELSKLQTLSVVLFTWCIFLTLILIGVILLLGNKFVSIFNEKNKSLRSGFGILCLLLGFIFGFVTMNYTFKMMDILDPVEVSADPNVSDGLEVFDTKKDFGRTNDNGTTTRTPGTAPSRVINVATLPVLPGMDVPGVAPGDNLPPLPIRTGMKKPDLPPAADTEATPLLGDSPQSDETTPSVINL